ncbi:hypothetical protein VII00023_20682 [Vibrio ichthyoenteri ATCC 700023]|uniref:Uncharacterized protein n=1 Tax=Vibrio ichthyoenteri ATCC 700023 TaxID=870968 RepID=F9S7U9_9VIBR|nr:hypothetical protein [Vibrio ichthyoenteri]EGU30999.1 hypothetical protein VII00023_20682 [Vibrio ichthyoenteri ATCC 700023]
MLSRAKLKEQENKIKDASSFVDGAEPKTSNPVGRPKIIAEKKQPVTMSLTKTEVGYLDSIPKRLNAISYSKGDELSLDRSNFIRSIAIMAQEFSDEELYEWFSMLHK